jgi:hypothetical protein
MHTQEAAPSGTSTKDFNTCPSFMTTEQFQAVLAYERRMATELWKGNYKRVNRFLSRAWIRCRDAHGAERDWFRSRAEATERLAQLQAVNERDSFNERLKYLRERRWDAYRDAVVGGGIGGSIEAQYDLVHIDREIAGLEEEAAIRWEWIASYTPESEKVYDHRAGRGEAQAGPEPLIVRQRGCARSRAQRGNSTRTRGSRRTSGTRAGPDDDSGGEPGPGEAGAAGEHFHLLTGGRR